MSFIDGLKSGFSDLTSGNIGGVWRGLGEFSRDYLQPGGIPQWNVATGEVETPEGTPSYTPPSITLAKEGLKNAPAFIAQTLSGVARAVSDTLKKYWYVPVIVGGVLVGYWIIRDKGRRAQIMRYVPLAQ